ncbi:integrase [Streptomyces nanshensis]|uniref:Integrase n=2 Tax=Streptomyces TaxID=1883 RepID=A0A1E7LU56_9ACTN|nr:MULTISPECIES: IS30 family transposase [Streptomyces]OEV19309.1 integrase [Streptomyces nanshensis]OEV19727.1 integrase [Streptomyces nanshensis]OEV21535.1 integrase [Streptomyces nanshensis]OEV22075.1 integrase [Streptomyces nanshensis]ONI48579.1 Integrase core domain protein [Streptomyces sp. IB2014 011-1]
MDAGGQRRVPWGRQPDIQKREEYFRLMDQGVSSREACRIIGINRRTGKRWRNGRAASSGNLAAPPVRRPLPTDKPSRYLREADRIHIADRLREKASIRTIAAELSRSPSTISREIRRNGVLYKSSGVWAYRPWAAQRRAEARRPRPKPGKIGQCAELRDFIQDHLQRRWSPEQICHALRARFPDRPEMHVTHETIYQALYVQGRGELRRELARSLRTGRTMRRPHRQSFKRQPRMSKDMVMISDRPAEVADRAIPGHWEGDLIIGKAHKSAIGTLVERSSRFVALVHLPEGRRPSEMRDALIETIGTLPAQLRRSLTWDQGSEMAMHKQFSVATDMPVYFCDPGSPWQRGSNENTNGLLRQYFPKGTDLARYSRQELDEVATELNSRPRKTLGWETPAERLAKLLTPTS